MEHVLSVRLRGKEIGLLKLINGKMEFSYNKNTIHPISLSLPIQNETFKEKACRAFFGGLLPENPNIRSLLAKKYKINEQNDFKLLEEIGRDCAGAISFHKVDEAIIEKEYYSLTGDILSDDELKKYIEELPFKPYLGKRLSLAGAQEKTAVCIIDGKIALPDNDVPTTHIIKTALPKYIQTIENEYICMKAAKNIGLDVADVEIKKINDLKFLLVKRFDRVEKKDSTQVKRLLQEDFAQALGVQSRDKYDVPLRDYVSVLNKITSPALAKSEFVKRIIFNYLIGNTDAHSKNFSIYWIEDDVIKLTPAYDILCSTIYDCDQRIAIKIGKAKYYNEITDDDWKLFANDMDISYKFIQTELKRQKYELPQIIKNLSDVIDCEICKLIYDDIIQRCK